MDLSGSVSCGVIVSTRTVSPTPLPPHHPSVRHPALRYTNSYSYKVLPSITAHSYSPGFSHGDGPRVLISTPPVGRFPRVNNAAPRKCWLLALVGVVPPSGGMVHPLCQRGSTLFAASPKPTFCMCFPCGTRGVVQVLASAESAGPLLVTGAGFQNGAGPLLACEHLICPMLGRQSGRALRSA
jgi:hypothetical protein